MLVNIHESRCHDPWCGEAPYGSRDKYFIGEFGRPEPELTAGKVEQQLRAKGGDRKSEGFNQSRNAGLKTVGESDNAAYIRARLERDGKTELLGRIDRHEISVHAAAIEAGFRMPTIQIQPTVQGFRRAIEKHLTAKASALKLQAERRAGEMLKLTRERGERAGQGGDRKSKFRNGTLIPELPDLDVTRKQSHLWQKLAAIAANIFNGYIASLARTRRATDMEATGGPKPPRKIKHTRVCLIGVEALPW